MPELETIFVQNYKPAHPFGLKAVTEIPLDDVVPTVVNAIFEDCGADVEQNLVIPERKLTALN